MAEDIKIFDGTNWKSLKGAEGPTVVSADVGNVARLGTDGKLLVAQADLDARYVNITGDTMTGGLIVERDSTGTTGGLQVNTYSDSPNSVLTLRKTRGTKAAQSPLLVNDTIGRINFNTVNSSGAAAGAGYIQSYVTQAPTTAGVGTTIQLLTVGLVGGVLTTFAANLDHTGVFSCAKGSFPEIDFAVITSFTGFCDFKNAISITQETPTPYAGVDVKRRVSGIGITSSVVGTDAATRNIALYALLPAGTASDSIGVWVDHYGSGTASNIGLYVHSTLPAGANNYVLYSVSPAQSSLTGNLGLNFLSPTHQLEVGGDTMLRGPLEVTGDITSAGTAHSFAAGSIPSSAVIGSTEFTPATSAAAGTAGSMRWDENFLYIRTATAWKRVALTAF